VSVAGRPPRCHVHEVLPGRWNGRTVVMVHGAMHTGRHYLRTLDGRPGWAADFAAAGYRVWSVDWPGVGDSPPIDPELFSGDYIRAGVVAVIDEAEGPVDLLVHSMSGPYGLDIVSAGSPVENLVAIAPGLPPRMSPRPDVVEDLGDVLRIVYGDVEWFFPKRGWIAPDAAFVTDKLLGGSTRFPAEVSPEDYLATLVPMWSGLTSERLRQVRAPRDEAGPAPDLRRLRALVMTGTHDRDHPREADARVAAWLRSCGAATDHCYLGDVGIHGNGHMLMLEDNSAELAALIVGWLAEPAGLPDTTGPEQLTGAG
jgi:pimeloyl-ACP methyl ester carboxylesterase